MAIKAAFKPADLAHLRRLARAGTVSARVSFRSRIVLLAAEGLAYSEIARRLGTTRKTVHRWHQRYVQGGVQALGRDAPGRGRKRSIPSDLIAGVLSAKERSARRGDRHSCRQLAEEFGVSAATISRILTRARSEHGSRSSSEPQF